MQERAPIRPGPVSLVVMALIVTACAGHGGSAFVRDYQAGRHAAALRGARSAALSSTGAARDEAALIAGLSAQALGDDASARAWLEPLLASRDRSVAARARAGLGLIAQRQGDHERAAALLAEASVALTGDDAARAALYAGQSLRALGRVEPAQREYRRAATLARSAEVRALAERRLGEGRFTIQVGAFTSRRNAERARRRADTSAAGLGLGPARVVVARRDGRAVYLVQVGEFATRADAVRARARLGPDAIVAAAPEQ